MTLSPAVGVRETLPVVVNVFVEPTVKLPLTVVVPEAAPNETVVAAPPILSVVAPVLKTLAVVLVVIRSADEGPFTVMLPLVVTLPVS